MSATTNNASVTPEPERAEVVEYKMCGVAVQKSPEGEAMVLAMRDKPGVEIVEDATFFDIRAPGKLVIDFEEVSEILGEEVDGFDLQVQFSTIYGRIVMTDEAIILFSDFGEAAAFMDHEGESPAA